MKTNCPDVSASCTSALAFIVTRTIIGKDDRILQPSHAELRHQSIMGKVTHDEAASIANSEVNANSASIMVFMYVQVRPFDSAKSLL